MDASTTARALLLTEAGTERKAGVWVRAPATPRPRTPLDGLGPDADQARRREPLAAGLHAPTRCGCTAFLRDQRAIAGIGRRLANEICHRAKLSPFANDAEAHRPTRSSRCSTAIGACIDEALAYERGRDDMSSSKPSGPARCTTAGRRAVPGLRRHHPGGRVPRLHGQLLPDLPDRRQGPRRQHHQQVPEVAPATRRPDTTDVPPVAATGHATFRSRSGRRSDEAELLDRVALLGELGDGGVDAGPGELVDVEALDDRVLAVRARCTGNEEIRPSGTP